MILHKLESIVTMFCNNSSYIYSWFLIMVALLLLLYIAVLSTVCVHYTEHCVVVSYLFLQMCVYKHCSGIVHWVLVSFQLLIPDDILFILYRAHMMSLIISLLDSVVS